MTEPPPRVDHKAIAALVGTCLVLTPAVLLGACWRLSDGLSFVDTSAFEWGAMALALIVLAIVIRRCAAELSASLGVHLDEQGVRQASTTLAWASITEVGSVQYGYLELRDGQGRAIRIATYLFADRNALLQWIGERVGIAIRERMLSA